MILTLSTTNGDPSNNSCGAGPCTSEPLKGPHIILRDLTKISDHHRQRHDGHMNGHCPSYEPQNPEAAPFQYTNRRGHSCYFQRMLVFLTQIHPLRVHERDRTSLLLAPFAQKFSTRISLRSFRPYPTHAVALPSPTVGR